MAPKSVLAEFRRRILKRPLEGDGSNNLEFVGFEDLMFTSAPNSAIPGVLPSKKQKGKKGGQREERHLGGP